MSLFDGRTLTGWYAVPRSYGTLWPGGPTVRDVLPTLPADYEANAEAHPARWVVVDGAIEGSIGGFYGNGTGGFHAVPFAIDAAYDSAGRPIGL